MKQNIRTICITAILLGMSTQSFAFDFGKFFSDVFSNIGSGFTTAGSKSSATTSASSTASLAKSQVAKNLLTPGECSSHYPWGVPRFKDKSVESNMIFTCGPYFALGYSLDKKIPLWSSEVMQSQNIEKSQALLSNSGGYKVTFEASPIIDASLQATADDYSSSGFNKLQFVSPTSMLYDENGFKESFYFTNIAPQVGPNMNNNLWVELELWIKEQAKMRGTLYITTGALFLDNDIKINNKISVPSHYYKIVVDPKINEAISFVIPNKQVISASSKKIDSGNAAFAQTKSVYNCSDKGKQVCSFFDFTTSISEVERLSGLRVIPIMEETNVVRKKVSDDFISTRRYGAALYSNTR